MIRHGSGGMFVQTGDFVNEAGSYRQIVENDILWTEKVEYNAQLCLMNMAVHGLTEAKICDEANTFYHDAHNPKAGCCDYVMANRIRQCDK